MKVLRLSLTIIFFFILGIGLVNAAEVSKSKLLKEIIISGHHVKKAYADGDKMNKTINRFFIKLKLKGKTIEEKKLNELKIKLAKISNKLNNIRYLTYKEEKLKKLVYNLYLRVLYELKY